MFVSSTILPQVPVWMSPLASKDEFLPQKFVALLPVTNIFPNTLFFPACLQSFLHLFGANSEFQNLDYLDNRWVKEPLCDLDSLAAKLHVEPGGEFVRCRWHLLYGTEEKRRRKRAELSSCVGNQTFKETSSSASYLVNLFDCYCIQKLNST